MQSLQSTIEHSLPVKDKNITEPFAKHSQHDAFVCKFKHNSILLWMHKEKWEWIFSTIVNAYLWNVIFWRSFTPSYFFSLRISFLKKQKPYRSSHTCVPTHAHTQAMRGRRERTWEGRWSGRWRRSGRRRPCRPAAPACPPCWWPSHCGWGLHK